MAAHPATTSSDAADLAGSLVSAAAAVVPAAVVYATARRWGSWHGLCAACSLPALVVLRRRELLDPGTHPTMSAWASLVPTLVSAALFRSAPPQQRAAWTAVGSLATGALTGAVAAPLEGPADSGPPLSATGVGLMLPAVAAAAAAAAGLGRARESRMRTVTTAAALLPCAVAAGAASTSSGPLRNRLVARTAVAWWPLAGALGVTALLRGRRGRAVARPQLDEVDAEAIEDFDRRYSTPRLADVAVVIAAYDEERGLPHVLAALPDTVCGLRTDVLVVDDGSADRTAAVVEADPRALLVRSRTNRGQGAALRLGYRVAREHGARFVVTTDADGQYRSEDLPTVLGPVLDGRADFVTGSRRLGRQHTYDRVRRTGVHVFAALVSLLVGRRITDTSFGLRAMRAEVTAAVTLNQVQYQSSELLIGVCSHGFRVLEVPATMNLRTAGASKKGRNLVYGRRYAGVVLGTWWREGCPRPAHETAPALRGSGAATTS